MHPFRWLVLTAGPVLLVGLMYGLSSGGVAPPLQDWIERGLERWREENRSPNDGDPLNAQSESAPVAANRRADSKPATEPAALEAACLRRADAIRGSLDRNCRVVVRPPYIVGGDGTEAQLIEAVDELILPIARTLRRCYFDKPPTEPIVVLMFTSGDQFQEHAQRLDGRRRDEYYGYYRREERRVMLNASTGGGTTAHELTHALAHFDFPSMPEWLDEGLASLHEEAQFSDDEDEIAGLSNWRVNHLLMGLRRGQVRTIRELVTSTTAVRDGLEAVDYAHARYFCLFLQQRQQLARYYRTLRDQGSEADPAATLETLFAPRSLEEIDAEFRQWCAKFRPISRRIPIGVRRS